MGRDGGWRGAYSFIPCLGHKTVNQECISERRGCGRGGARFHVLDPSLLPMAVHGNYARYPWAHYFDKSSAFVVVDFDNMVGRACVRVLDLDNDTWYIHMSSGTADR